MKKMNKSPLAAAMGAAVISTLSATANAEANPFGMTELNSGYMQVAAGEMSCGANMGGMDKSGMNPPQNKTAEGACAGNKSATATAAQAKAAEKKCAGYKSATATAAQAKAAEKKCAGYKSATATAAPAKAAEGKCGEGKCGGMMDDGKMKKGMESSCGAMMKGKEGSCGATK